MRAGQLTEKVLWLKRKITVNAYNEQEENFDVMGELCAEVQVSSNSLQLKIEREVELQTLTAVVRSYNNIQIADRVEWRGNTYDVASVLPDRKLNRLILTLKLIEV